MARATVILALLAALTSPAAATESQGTPVQKVIEMMNEMLAKGKAEKEAETKLFEEYAEWVDDESRETGFTIKTAKADIEELTAEAEKPMLMWPTSRKRLLSLTGKSRVGRP